MEGKKNTPIQEKKKFLNHTFLDDETETSPEVSPHYIFALIFIHMHPTFNNRENTGGNCIPK